MKLTRRYIYVILISFLFPLEYSDFGFEIFTLAGDAQVQSLGGAPYENSMSLCDIYSLNEFHHAGKISLSYANYYSGIINFFQSSYIIKKKNRASIGIAFLHKKINNIPNTENAWEDIGQVISQDEINYDNIDYYDDEQVSVLLLYSLNFKDTKIGFKIKPIYTSILDYSAFGITFDIGANKEINNNYSIGINIENLYSVNHWSTGETFSIYPKLELSNTLKFNKVYLIGELSSRYKSIDYRLGVEINIKDYLQFRLGYSSYQSITTGIGFEFNEVFYSYSYSPYLKDIILGHNHQFSILLDLSKVRL